MCIIPVGLGPTRVTIAPSGSVLKGYLSSSCSSEGSSFHCGKSISAIARHSSCRSIISKEEGLRNRRKCRKKRKQQNFSFFRSFRLFRYLFFFTLLDPGPGIPQGNCPVEYELAGRRIGVHAKVSHSFELVTRAGRRVSEAWLDLAAG